MDTQSLRLFILAAEKLNISAAGRQLGMAPAVASTKLAKLEHTVGAELLHRSTRKVALSLEGAEFLPFAKEMIAQEAAGLAALGHGSSKVTGTLRFAAPSTFSQLYIAPIIRDFLEQNPGISLDLRLSDTRFDLIEGSFDLALRNLALADSSLKGRKLANDERVLCASPAYVARYGLPTRPSDLKNHHLIGFIDQQPKSMIGPQGDEAVFDPRQSGSRLTFDDGLSQKRATVAGAGVSVNSIWSVHQELREGALVPVLPGYKIADQSALWLVYPKSNVLTAKVRTFIDFLLDQIGRDPPWLRE